MNITAHGDVLARLRELSILLTRRLGHSTTTTFSSVGADQTLQRIYVINLDRKADRWRRISREPMRVRDREGRPLASMTRRISAVDARYVDSPPSPQVVDPQYTLAEQLFVQPDPLLVIGPETRSRVIDMTRQELAVASSHVAVWRLIAGGDVDYALVLEDDSFFTRTFASCLGAAWAELAARDDTGDHFDVLYLSYKEGSPQTSRQRVSDTLFAPATGLWQLSGYVLSRSGAQRLLDLLPVRGPVDLWINHQLRHLDVLATRRSIIQQRRADPSSNSYSVLPVLSQVGALTREKPLLPKRASLPRPVFVAGAPGTGHTALAMALSMLGYRVCSDVSGLPAGEYACVVQGGRNRVFDAYVNVGGLGTDAWSALAGHHHDAQFIVTTDGQTASVVGARPPNPNRGSAGTPPGGDQPSSSIAPWQSEIHAQDNTLVLPKDHPDKWELVSGFLGCEYPSHLWPECDDVVQRPVDHMLGDRSGAFAPPVAAMKWDASPWIVDTSGWAGIPVATTDRGPSSASVAPDLRAPDLRDAINPAPGPTPDSTWVRRDDTFPGNLSLFRPQNVTSDPAGVTHLWLREEPSTVRDYTAAAIATRDRYRCGRFAAELRASNISGVVTGLFLHRNTPRQEIDIELLGKNPRMMLVNVYYNPGLDGDKLEYGYRGTPSLIELGFDASADFHLYEIEWQSECIRWRVDGDLVHERVNWEPTPIPHLPMQFNINIWPSRSKELAGGLAASNLPTSAEVRRVRVQATKRTGP